MLHPVKNLLIAEKLSPGIVNIEFRRSSIYGALEKV